jgi:hypothetical protein
LDFVAGIESHVKDYCKTAEMGKLLGKHDFSLVEIFFSWSHKRPQGSLVCLNVCDCTDAQATVLMTDNCLNERFVRNTVIPVGMKPDPTTAGGIIAL